MKLTENEAWQLKVLITDNMERGSHYGRKDYWDKRNKSILEKLKEAQNAK